MFPRMNENGRMLYSDGTPLCSLCNNVLASRLGNACNKANKQRAGDSIDRGLSLLKELNNLGFDVVERR